MNYVVPVYPLLARPVEAEPYPDGWHLNMRWTVEDMDFIAAEVSTGVSASEIAETYEVPERVILELFERNGIKTPEAA